MEGDVHAVGDDANKMEARAEKLSVPGLEIDGEGKAVLVPDGDGVSDNSGCSICSGDSAGCTTHSCNGSSRSPYA